MATEECAICGDDVPFATTTHVLVNPKHVEGVADHYVCRPCYDDHLEGLFVALASDDAEAHDDESLADEVDSGELDRSEPDGDSQDDAGDGDDLAVNVVEEKVDGADPSPVASDDVDEPLDPSAPD